MSSRASTYRIRDAAFPLEAQPTIFERFTQAERSDAKRGSGLGLWICKPLADLHGGTISLDSAPRRGTTFRFTIKLHV